MSKRGNSTGNISNGGMAALAGGVLYYSNSIDDWTLYKTVLPMEMSQYK